MPIIARGLKIITYKLTLVQGATMQIETKVIATFFANEWVEFAAGSVIVVTQASKPGGPTQTRKFELTKPVAVKLKSNVTANEILDSNHVDGLSTPSALSPPSASPPTMSW